jgi:hypothetical protein
MEMEDQEEKIVTDSEYYPWDAKAVRDDPIVASDSYSTDRRHIESDNNVTDGTSGGSAPQAPVQVSVCTCDGCPQMEITEELKSCHEVMGWQREYNFEGLTVT